MFSIFYLHAFSIHPLFSLYTKFSTIARRHGAARNCLFLKNLPDADLPETLTI